MASTFAIQSAKQVVATLYEAAGAMAIFNARPFERRFRDIHTVTQQIQGHPEHFETVGQVLLGRKPDRPLFTFSPKSGLQEPDPVALQNGTGQLAAHHRTGVDADAVGPHGGIAGRGVAMHHNGAEVLLKRQKRLPDPKQIIPFLHVRRHSWPNARMREEVGPDAMGQRQAAQKSLMREGNHSSPNDLRHIAVDPPAQQRFSATIADPMGAVLRSAGADRLDHHVFMIAHQIDHRGAGDGRADGQQFDNFGTFGPAIDVIAQMYQQALVHGAISNVLRDHRMQGPQLLKATVYIANRVNALAVGQSRWSWDKFRHGEPEATMDPVLVQQNTVNDE